MLPEKWKVAVVLGYGPDGPVSARVVCGAILSTYHVHDEGAEALPEWSTART